MLHSGYLLYLTCHAYSILSILNHYKSYFNTFSLLNRLLTNEHVHSKTGTLLNTCPPPVPSAPLSTLTDTKSTANDILGDISSSDDDSSSSESEDSSSEEEDEGDINKQEKEENKKIKVEKTPDENTSFMLDQVK